MIYTCKPKKVAIYVNTERKPLTQIKAETGCTALINGGLYGMATFTPVCHLKVDGKVLAQDRYKYWGFAWNTNDLTLTTDYSEYDNYICCVCLVRDGKAEKLIYDSALSGYRPRTAFGVFPDGRVWLYAVATPGQTPEQLQRTALAAGVKHAIMLDGGGSTQGASPGETMIVDRRVHNFICVWDEVEAKKTEPKGAEPTMFEIALGAGHSINSAGKRCLKSLDPNETREWWLNDRVCDYIEAGLREYEGYNLLRTDDSDDGKDNIALSLRAKEANAWGADVYISIHHNAGANGTTAGGIVAFSHPNDGGASHELRDELYTALIKHTGLKGNRWKGNLTGDYQILRETKMPAVLLELGFMDSSVDVPIILTDDYARKCAAAIVEVLVKRGKLTKKKNEAPKTDEPWYAEAQRWAVENGIADGERPEEPATRAEVWAMLHRAVSLLNK